MISDSCYITPNCQINQWSWIQLNTKCAHQEFLAYLICIDLISDSCYIITADYFGVFTLIYVDICSLRTSSITPNCQINQWSWIQLNTKCVPQEFLAYLISWFLTAATLLQLIILGFSRWYMFVKNLQHHSKLSNKPMKLNAAKYIMCAPRVSFLFNKFKLDFWQELKQNSW